MEFVGYIYCITCIPNGKLYFGQTVNTVHRRWKEHIKRAKGNGNSKFYNSMRKYGEENFVVEEVMSLSAPTKELLKEKLDYVEMYFIKRYDTKRNGYNSTDGGDNGTLGMKLSEETKRKMSEMRRGSGNPNYGRKFSEEFKKKLSDYQKKRFEDPEERRKTGVYTKKRCENPEYLKKLSKAIKRSMEDEIVRKKISEAKKGKSTWNKGIPSTKDFRRKVSESRGGHMVLQFTINNDFVKEWISVKEIRKTLPIMNRERLKSHIISGKPYKGYIWKYKDEL